MLNTCRSRIMLPKTDSTNREAFRIMEQRCLEEGTLIITPWQTAGRGQAGASWESEPYSNLTFSVILKPHFLEVSRQFLLSKVVALAVKEGIEDLVIPHRVFIKWPNDIYIGHRKIGGLLLENRIMGLSIQVCVAGIGININQRVFQSDAPNPVSMGQLTQRYHNTDEILRKICHSLEKRYNQLEQGDSKAIDHDYLQSLYGINQEREYSSHGKTFRAKAVGVNEYGKLILEKPSGECSEYDMKEVSFLL